MPFFRAFLLATLLSLTDPLAGAVVSIAVESGVTQDEGANTFYFANDDFIHLTPNGRILFNGRTDPLGDDDMLVLTLPGQSPEILYQGVDGNNYDQLVYNGKHTVALEDELENLQAVNVSSGEVFQQGSLVYGILDVSDDGRALYVAWDENANIQHVRLGNGLIYTESETFESYATFGFEWDDVMVDGDGNVFIGIEGASEESGQRVLLTKNGDLLQTYVRSDFASIRPGSGSDFILHLNDPGRALLNGEHTFLKSDDSVPDIRLGYTVLTGDGDIYFNGGGEILFYDASAPITDNKAVVETVVTSGTEGFPWVDFPIGESSRGDLVFKANGPEAGSGLFLFDAEKKEVRSLIRPGDQVEGRTVSSINVSYEREHLLGVGMANNQVAVAGRLEDSNSDIVFHIDLYPINPVVTLEIESGVTLDKDGNTIYIGEEDYTYMTPEGSILFHGAISQFDDPSLIFSSKPEETPSVLHIGPLWNDSIYDITDLIYTGDRYLGYIDPSDNIQVLDITTGEAEQRGAQVREFLSLSDDGQPLYVAWDEADSYDRVWLGNTLQFIEQSNFGDFTTGSFGPYQDQFAVSATGDVYIALSAHSEATGNVDLVLKNGVQLFELEYSEFEYLVPATGDNFLLFKNFSNYWASLNGEHDLKAPDGTDPDLSSGYNLITDDGDIYLTGGGEIWYFDASQEPTENGVIVKKVLSVQDHGLSFNFAPIGETSKGDLVFAGRDLEAGDGIFLYEAGTDQVIPLLTEADEPEGRIIAQINWNYYGQILAGVGFANDQVVVSAELDDTENWAIFRIEIYGESVPGNTAPVYTVSELCPEVPAGAPEAGEQLYPDPFMASDPIQLNEGPCGGDWHMRIWKDTGTGKDIPGYTPGIPGNEDVIVRVEETDLALSKDPIELEAVFLTGSFQLNNSLTLRNDSAIEDTTINADLETNGQLVLSGQSTWLSGRLLGTGEVNIPAGETNHLLWNAGARALGLRMTIAGNLTQGGGELNLLDAAGEIVITDGGKYTINAQTVSGERSEPNFLNSGTLLKISNTEAAIGTPFKNTSGGNVQIQQGTLKFSKSSIWLGNVSIAPFSTAVFNSGPHKIAENGGFVASGFGDFILNDAEVILSGDQNQFDISAGKGSPNVPETFFDVAGGVVIQGETIISGEHPYRNMGITFMEDGLISAPIINDLRLVPCNT